MSIRVMDRVIHAKIGEYIARHRPAGEEQPVSPAAIKFVLYKMADWGADDGSSIYPAVPTIAKLTEMSERTVQRAIGELVRSGLLVLVKQGGGSLANEYRIAVEKLQQLDLFAETTHRKPAKAGDIGVARTVDKSVENNRCQSVTGAEASGDRCHTDTSTGDSMAPSTTIINHHKTTNGSESVKNVDNRDSDRLWQLMFKAYPKQIDPAGSLEAFNQEVRNGANPQQIADASAYYACQMKREGKDEQFIPYPANWLSKGLYKLAIEAMEKESKAAEKLEKDRGPVPPWANHPSLDEGARLWMRGAKYEGKSPLGDKAFIKVPRKSQRDFLRNHYSCDLQVIFGVKEVEIELQEAGT